MSFIARLPLLCVACHVLIFIRAATGLPACGADVIEYVAKAVERGVGPPSSPLTSCACIFDTRTGFTPLHEVALRGGLRAGGIIGILVHSNADVLTVDAKGETALHIAARVGLVPAAAALIDAALREHYLTNLLSAEDRNGLRALDLAEDSQNMEMMLFLGQQGATRSERRVAIDECSSPLADAVLRGDLEALQAALSSTVGAEEGSTDATCFYPPARRMRPLLHIAVAACGLYRPRSGLAIMQTLLTHGANASRADGSGDLPLNRAARYDRKDILNALLSTMPGQDVDLQDARGRTALHEAARVGARTAAVTLVISGASLGIRDNAGLTPLDYARQEGHTKVISAIDMAIRLPPSKLNVPGYMHNSGDDFPSDVVNSADEEKGTNVAAIIGIVLGILLGAAVALVLTVGIRRYRLRNGDNKVLALPTRDTSDKPSPPRALCKDAFDDLERSGIESSDEDGATFKHMSSEPVVLQVAGRQHTKEFSTSSPSSPAKHPPDTLAQMPSKPSQNEGEYTCPKCGAVQPRRIFCCKCGEPTPKTAPSAQKAPPPGPMSPTENSLNNLVCSLRNAGRMDARHFTDAPAVPAIPKVLALEDSTTHSSSRQAQAFTYGRNRSASQVGLCEFPDGSPKASGDLQAAEQSRVRRPK